MASRGPDTVPHVPSTPHNSHTCLTPCANDPFARARIAAAQSRVAAPTLSDPHPPPPRPTFSPHIDKHYWCSKCPRRGFTTIPGLMRHFTTQHTGTQVDEPTRALLVAVERVTCTDSTCGGFRRAGARTCNKCSQPTPARPPAVGDCIMGPLGVSPPEAASTSASPVPLSTFRTTSRNVSVPSRPAPCCTFPRVAGCG